MPNDLLWLIAAVVLGTLGMYLMLPPRRGLWRYLGGIFNFAALGFIGAQAAAAGGPRASLFWVVAFITLAGAVGTVISRNAVYCALWFGLTLIGTAGLFLLIGAQFLALATIVVYAGAILVTFLFVLMLANPRGVAPSDRMSWEALTSAAAGAIIVGVLTSNIMQVQDTRLEPAAVTQTKTRQTIIENEQHVAVLGRHLFSEHLIAVEVAATLLMVGLVGAVAIVAHSKEQTATERSA